MSKSHLPKHCSKCACYYATLRFLALLRFETLGLAPLESGRCLRALRVLFLRCNEGIYDVH